MKTPKLIRTNLLRTIIKHGICVKEYMQVKRTIGIPKRHDNNVFFIDEKLTQYLNK